MTSLRIPISQVDLLIAQGASRKQMQRVCIVVTHEPCHGGDGGYALVPWGTYPVSPGLLPISLGYNWLQNLTKLHFFAQKICPHLYISF
jgi:hypothetical protein